MYISLYVNSNSKEKTNIELQLMDMHAEILRGSIPMPATYAKMHKKGWADEWIEMRINIW